MTPGPDRIDQNHNEEEKDDPSISFGRFLANPPSGEEIVISGLSGAFPESENVYEFQDNLFKKVNMVTGDPRRWYSDHPDVPQNTGKLKTIDRFDAGYFGVHPYQVEFMDPTIRLFYEKTIEAIMDAGINPKELEGTRTGVYMGVIFSESEKYAFVYNLQSQSGAITGNERSMIAHRISYFLKLKGPSYNIDTACSSSLYCIEEAYKALRQGTIDYAIIGGGNLCLHPVTSLQFKRLGVLSDDGTCKVFDQAADGYARAETISVLILQKSKFAKRSYGTIAHIKCNCDGFKEEGVNFPSSKSQRELFEQFYMECPIRPKDVSFVEAHGTGTTVGDPQELEAVGDVFLKDRKGPLLIGSVKSNMGHSEGAAGVAAVAKCIVAFESGYIAPNINFKTPKDSIKELIAGNFKIVVNKQPLVENDATMAINSFGFGGANGHLLLQRHKKMKMNHGLPADDFPRIVGVSARSEEGVSTILNDVSNRELDVEYIWLLHQTFRINYERHYHRGFSIISKTKEINRSCAHCLEKKPLHLSFTSFDNPKAISSTLFKLPLFENFVQTIQETKQGVKNNDSLDDLALQLGIVYLFKELEIEIEDISNSKETVKLYLKKSITLKEALSSGNLENGVSSTKKCFSKMNQLIINIGDNAKSTLSLSSKGDIFLNLLEILGKLYLHGHSPQFHKLYPHVSTPVSRTTPMIAPLIKWHHDKQWFICRFTLSGQPNDNVGQDVFYINLDDEQWNFVQGHTIDGRNLYPATGYLYLVWLTVLQMQSNQMDVTGVKIVFENVRFIRATTVPKTGSLELNVMIQRNSGNFEVVEGDTVVVSGRALVPEEMTEYQIDISTRADEFKKQKHLNGKDIYKELRLRGYNYTGAFRELLDCDNSASMGKVKWEGNWISFMDNLLQIKILQLDTRLLYVPTFIHRLSIDPLEHLKYVGDFGENSNLPVYVNDSSNIIRCGFIEIRGLMASSIPRRKPLGEPVLEKYIFVPNEGHISLSESLRVNVQIILDDTLTNKVKGVEVVDEETSDELLSPLIVQALEDLPLIQPDLKIFSKDPLEVKGIDVENKKLVSETECLLIIGTKVLQKPTLLQQSIIALAPNGYLLSREPIDYNVEVPNLVVITSYIVSSSEKLVLLKKSLKVNKFITINVDDNENFTFLPSLKEAINSNLDVLIYSQKPQNGILGLINCLRREPNGTKIRGVFVVDENTPTFDPNHLFYKEIIDKGIASSVYKNGQWGTYRHLLIPENEEILKEHCYSNNIIKGDLSSFRWIEGPLSSKSILESEQILVKTHYSALNFKDIMMATGRISVDVITQNRLDQDCVQGFEYSGIELITGRRVMGLVKSGALATMVPANPYLLWPVPDFWSLEEAATVPCVYCTVIYGLLMRMSLKKGMSILIHAGSGGIGLAAINIALHYGCEIFTTVGTKEKREFILKKFPQLKKSHVGNSRDTSFEWMIKNETKGRGVDVVLNSLAEEKLLASVRCLAHGGHFVEIGKFDLANNNPLQLLLMKKEASFHGVGLDQLFEAEPGNVKTLSDLLIEGIKNGSVKPLLTTIFKHDEIEQAYRYMATGKHIAKVLIEICKEESKDNKIPKMSLTKAIPRFYCDPNKVQIITGGLGGFGLELADWLILRGARKLLLVSRSGIKTGYQAYRIKIWTSYGVSIKISKVDITTKEGCKELLETATTELGEVESIFNLAVILKDAIFDNQTQETFEISFGPKAFATQYLDELSRKISPNLKNFVIFSSVSCGRGNAGQTNYGMANSVMERICEKRREDGFPGLAIQWGAVGDVGLVAEFQEDNFEMEIGGTLQQRISSCLEVMDTFLCSKYPVVSSMVVAEKKSGGSADNIIDSVANILGIRDIKTVSFQSTLAELGMDSMTAVEIKTTLEREFEIMLTPQDIRAMTFARLQEIQDERQESSSTKVADDSPIGFDWLIMDEETSKLTMIPLASRSKNLSDPKVPFFPGIDGIAKTLEVLTQNLNVNTVGLQFDIEHPKESIQEIAKSLLAVIEDQLTSEKPFQIVAYSFGVAIALEVISILENKGIFGTIICIDGSPDMATAILKTKFNLDNENIFQTTLLCHMMTKYLSATDIAKHYENILTAKTFDEKLNVCSDIMTKNMINSTNYLKKFTIATYKRLQALYTYTPSFTKLKSKIILLKPTIPLIKSLTDDYKLGELCSQNIDIKVFEGDHFTILQNQLVADFINEIFENDKGCSEQFLNDNSRKSEEKRI